MNKVSLLFPIILLSLLQVSKSPAAVDVIAGSPATEIISEPFSVDFDAKGVLHGVEFTKSNRVFRVIKGKVEFIAGFPHISDEKSVTEDVCDGPDPMKAIFKGMHDIQITRDGKALIGDSFHNRVRLFDLNTGHVSTIAGTGKSGFGGDGGSASDASFSITMTASLSPDQTRYYIADIGNSRTRMVDLVSGKVSTVAGNGKKGLPIDGANALESPTGDTRAVAQAKDGTLYILLRGGNSLVAMKDGKLRTVVNASGKAGYGGDGGQGREALMNGPKYVAIDAIDNVLICDTENHCIRRYMPKTGIIELIAGSPTKAGNTLGLTFLDTQLRRPHGLRIGPDGSLYIADTYNNRVLKAEYK